MKQRWDEVTHRPMKRRFYYNLTLTEMNVLQAACAGAGTRDKIAQVLGIAPSTVRSHLSRIYARLNVGSFAEMILFALRDPKLRRVCFPEIKNWRQDEQQTLE